MASSFTLPSAKGKETASVVNRAINNAKDYAGELNVDVLPISSIEIDPNNKREFKLTLEDAVNGIDKNDPMYNKKKEDWKSLESLAKTIKDDQLINPIYVYRFGTMCRLISGERRTLASAIAGKKNIIARIAPEKPAGTKLRVLQWIENQERSDLSIGERVASIEDIISEYKKEKKLPDEFNVTTQLISDLTGMAMTNCRRYKLMLEAEPKLKKAILSGKIDNLKIIDLIEADANRDIKDLLTDLAISGKQFSELEKICNENQIKIKNNLPKIETRGRKRTSVSLGTTKPFAVQVIMKSLVENVDIDEETRGQIIEIYQNTNWKDVVAATKQFKKTVSIIEKGIKE